MRKEMGIPERHFTLLLAYDDDDEEEGVVVVAGKGTK